jgi:O-antigen/teichoic acid export membrane protein
MVARYIATGAKAATGLVVATTLGATGAGTFALVHILPHVAASLLGMGVTIAIPYLVGSRKYSVQAITETAVAMGLILSGAAWVAWYLCSGFLHARFYSALSPEVALFVGVAIPLVLLRNYLNSIQQGLQTFKAANLVLCVEDVGALLIVLPLLWGWGVESSGALIVAAAVGGAGASCLTATGLLLRRGIWPWPRLHRAIATEAVAFGLKGHVGRIANMLNWRLDTLILSTLTSVEIVGYYAVASQVAELFRPLSMSLTYVLRPLMASLSVAEARLRSMLLYRRVFALNLAFVVVMAFIGGRAIVLLFGDEFTAAVPAFQILLIGLAAHGANGVLTGYNVGIGRPEFNTYTALAGLVVTVAGDLLLIPPYGVIGAAIASSVAYTVKALTLTTLFLWNCGATFSQLTGLKEYSPDPA